MKRKTVKVTERVDIDENIWKEIEEASKGEWKSKGKMEADDMAALVCRKYILDYCKKHDCYDGSCGLCLHVGKPGDKIQMSKCCAGNPKYWDD